MMTNYVIWGIPPGLDEERVLVEKLDGDYIISLDVANEVALHLELNKGVRYVRIQTIDMSDGVTGNFIKAIQV